VDTSTRRGPIPTEDRMYPSTARASGTLLRLADARGGTLLPREHPDNVSQPATPVAQETPHVEDRPQLRAVGDQDVGAQTEEGLLLRIARGDEVAFGELYDRVAGPIHGVIRRVLRDPARSEEVTQEVLLEIWRTAARFDPERGAASTWMFTMAHRRAIDRVRSVQSSRDRDQRVGTRDHAPPFDQVAETVETRSEHDQVRAALDELTELQRETVELAYYGGYTYREVSELLDAPLGTIKTRMRDGLIRLRDALGVTT
jgi:RNA polymerase sigma-70 factor, ECF subfamily